MQKNARHRIINHANNPFCAGTQKTKFHNVVCKHYIHPSTNKILFVTIDANCSSYTHHIKELFCIYLTFLANKSRNFVPL